ncbi:MAG: bifunctional adenosylcobinamide kinase/adenosylcobinamide-phosphate guanylyltransferase [Bryobacteraceae bacterium]
MILIGGGSRSGKSTEALRMLRHAGPRMGFIATATPSDEEMHERIERHHAERGPAIVTWEEPIALAERILAEDGRYDAIVVDCLTLWLSNLMLSEASIEAKTEELLQVAVNTRTQIIFVTNEVGCGIVPENALARRFRDEAGRLNQRFAARASEVYWMVFGIGLRLK